MVIGNLFKVCNVEPRPYQERLTSLTIKNLIEKNAKSVLIESPVGSGKTIMGLIIAKYLEDEHNDKVGWVAMRHNLLTQAQNENVEKGINAKITTISMYDKNPPVNLDTLIIDECQHDAASSMAHIHNTVNPKRIIGLSGTPFRTDRVKLCFEVILRDFGIHRLIKDGYLARYIHYTIPDWQVETVVGTYLRDKQRWGKSLIYFHTLDKCAQARDLLNLHNIRAEVVSGGTDIEKQIFDFREGKLDVLLNCLKLTEGFDCPSIKTVFAKPSCKGVTIQMCGRAFRKFNEYEFKQIVQPKVTPWPFIKTALPEQQYIWEHNEWRSLTLNEKIKTAYKNTVFAIAHCKTELPKFLTQQKNKNQRRFNNERRGF